MQVNEYDFKRINLRLKELDLRLTKLEQEIAEFREWHSSRFPKESPVESNAAEFHESLTDKQDVEE